MKKQNGYIFGTFILVLNIAAYALLFGILSASIIFFNTFFVKDIGIYNNLVLMISLLASVCIAYFSVKSFVKRCSVPDHKKIIICVFGSLLVLDFGINFFYKKDFSSFSIYLSLVQYVLVGLVVLGPIKINSSSDEVKFVKTKKPR